MKIIIEGRNYKVVKLLNQLKDKLAETGSCVHYSVVGKSYAQSNARHVITTSVSIADVIPLLENVNACVEVVEETPGVIFKYVSDYGTCKFTIFTEEKCIDVDYDDFEDEESYNQRMCRMGVYV